jgi:hypothetical protein
LAVVGGLLAGGWWLFSGGPVHPEARYLPARCHRFVSIRWPELAQSGFAEGRAKIPGLTLRERCAVFLRNAGLGPEEIERINAGQAADEVDFLIVYRLTRPVDPDEIMERPSFRLAKYEREEFRGLPMYRYGEADSAVAFPEESVILTGSTDLVRGALRRPRSGFRGPSSEMLETLDFSAMSVAVTDGVPRNLLDAHLDRDDPLARSIRGASDRFEYGATLHFVRELFVDGDTTPGRLQRSLENSLAQSADAPANSETVRQMLASVQVSAAEGKVQIHLDLEADQLSRDSLEALGRLF